MAAGSLLIPGLGSSIQHGAPVAPKAFEFSELWLRACSPHFQPSSSSDSHCLPKITESTEG